MKRTYCLVSAQYLPTMGGVENYTFNLAKKLTERGHKCIVITSSLANLKEIEIDENGITIIRLDSFQFLNGRFPFVKFNKKNYTILKDLLKYENLRFIINTRIYPLSLLVSKFAKKYNIKSFIIEHGSYYLSLNNALFDFVIKIYEHVMINLVKANCNNFFGVSSASSNWLLNFKIKSKGEIYNAIDINKINNINKDTLDLSLYNLNENAKIISYVGRLIPEKGVDKLLIAFKELNLENTYLIFAGEGYLEDFLKENKNNNTILLGKLSYNEVISLFKQSNIFCLPTVSEGFPTTVLEASSCGCYTITTKNSGGATEIISSDEFGTIMSDNSINEIKKALLNALNDKYLQEKANNAKFKVINNFTWDSTAQKIENLN